MFVRANIYHELSGFDGYFFAHSEEIDLCWRMQLAGYKIMCCPSSIVYHVGGGTLPKGHRKTFLNFRNNLIMLSKNLPVKEKLWKMPLRIWLDAVFAWKCLLTGDGDAFMAIIEAQGALLKWGLRKKNKNKNNYLKKPMASLAGAYPKSLVFDYFIKKKKRFSEIVDNKI